MFYPICRGFGGVLAGGAFLVTLGSSILGFSPSLVGFFGGFAGVVAVNGRFGRPPPAPFWDPVMGQFSWKFREFFGKIN